MKLGEKYIKKSKLIDSNNYLIARSLQIAKIEEGCFNKFSQLIILDLSNNQLKYIDQFTFDGLTQLKQLYLNENKIAIIEENTFQPLVKLELLSLKSNQITTINTDAFNNLYELKTLYLNQNMLGEIRFKVFNNLVALEELYLDSNQIEAIHLEDFTGLENLKILNLNYNLLEIIDYKLFDFNSRIELDMNTTFSSRARLELMFTSRKIIESSIFKGLPILEELYLDGNEITIIQTNAFLSLKSLKKLSFENNNIYEIYYGAFNKLDKLRELNLNLNKLTQIELKVFNGLNSLEELKLNSNEIQSIILQEFTGLPSLKSFYLNYNQIEKINLFAFHRMKNLQILELYENRIEKFVSNKFYGLPHLRELNLGGNKLTRVSDNAFEAMLNLEKLSLNKNQISEISSDAFDKLESLKELLLNHNKLTSVQLKIFNSLISLEELNLGSNEIEFLSSDEFSGLNSLLVLNLDQNKIYEIEGSFLSVLPSLTELYLQYNQISSIASNLFTQMNKLEILAFYNNSIESIEQDAFNGLTSLRQLFLGENKLTSIQENTFRSMKSLELLSLNKNQINEIKKGAFSNLENLEKIYLNKNQISEISSEALKDLTSLRYLYLNSNKIKQINNIGLDHLDSLEELNLDSNEIKTIFPNEFINLSNLAILYLSNNQIETIEPDAFMGTCLKQLELSYNKLKEIQLKSFNGLKLLSDLYLDHNEIEAITLDMFYGLESLTNLELSSNRIEEIAEQTLSHLTKLNKLNLESNQIKTINEFAFVGLNELWNLNLSYNQLIKFETFSGLSNLTEINCSNNKISYIKPNSIRMFEDLNVDFRDNIQFNLVFYVFKALFSITELARISDEFKKVHNIKYISDKKKLFFLVRNLSEEYLSNFLLSLYLNKSVKNSSEIFNTESEDSYLFKKDKLEKFHYTILDFIMSLDDLDTNFIMSLNSFVMNKLEKNKSIENLEFKLKSSLSFRALCKRNNLELMEAFFEKILVIKSDEEFKNINLEDKIFNEKDFFLNINYIECFEIVLNNQNENMAICVYKLINYAFKKFNINNSESGRDSIFFKFNQAFFDKFLSVIFKELKWIEFIEFILEVARKFDQNSLFSYNDTIMNNYNRQRHSKRTNQFFKIVNTYVLFNNNRKIYPSADNSHNTKFDEYDSKNKTYEIFLNVVSDSIKENFLSYEHVASLLDLKWKYLPRFIYYTNLILYILFLVFFSINLLTLDATWSKNSKIISLILNIWFLILELIQLVESLINAKILEYLLSIKNIIELFGYPLCLTAIALSESELKSALNSITILIAYWIFILKLNKLEKFNLIGSYVNVFGKIIRKSLSLGVIILIILIGFVISFQNRSYYYNKLILTNQSFNQDNNQYAFNGTFELNLYKILIMFVGGLDSDSMGISSLDKSSAINFIIYGVFIFLMPILFINIFTGISIDEVQKLIKNAKNEIVSNKIEYTLKIERSSLNPYLKRLENYVNTAESKIYKMLFKFKALKKIIDNYSTSRRTNEIDEINELKQLVAKQQETQEKLLREFKNMNLVMQNCFDFLYKIDEKFDVEFQTVNTKLERFQAQF